MKKLIENGYGPIVFGFAIAFGVVLGSYLNFDTPTKSLFKANFKNQKIQRLLEFINKE
jgi:hypothetical protein